MYVDTGRDIAPETLSRWQQHVKDLGCERSPSGSWFSPMPATVALFQSTLDAYFPPARHWVTAVSLMAGQQIPAHVDAALPSGVVRAHVQLIANDQCWSLHDGVWQQLTIGRIYRMDPAIVHGAVNWGSTARVNLIVDYLEAA